MPYSGVIGATPGSLNAITTYLINAQHDNHEGYELTPLKFCGVGSVEEFSIFCRKGFQRNLRKRSGHPPENGFYWLIVRMPDGTYLKESEMLAYEEAAIDAGTMGAPLGAILNWHINPYTGASDLNVLIPAFDEIGRPVRQRGTDPRRFLRRAMDQMTDELNVIRDADGNEVINTMQMVKMHKAKERGEIDVVEELAKLQNPPKNENSLIDGLLYLRCTISRYNSEEDTISITPEGKKKAKRFRISTLLEDIGQAVRRLMTKSTKKAKKKSRTPEKQKHPTRGL